MASKILMYNDVTGEVVATTASLEGHKFANFIEKGFKPICIAYPVGYSVAVESYTEDKHIRLTKK